MVMLFFAPMRRIQWVQLSPQLRTLKTLFGRKYMSSRVLVPAEIFSGGKAPNTEVRHAT